MYSYEIKKLIEEDCHLKSAFKGIYSADTIPKNIGAKKFVVFNTAPKNHKVILPLN